MVTINWVGKEEIVNHDKDVPYKLLKKVKKLSIGYGSKNLIIKGDNLEGLKALLPYYSNSVKCAYIDPPYGTGNEGWVYNDNINSITMKKWFKKNIKQDDLCKHDKWLCMMYPRLKLLRELLSDEGVIFVSIDDSEQANLKMLMDEIFDEKNYITTIIRNIPDGTNLKKISTTHEYVLMYKKEKDPELFVKFEENSEIDTRLTKNGKHRSKILFPKGLKATFKNNKIFRGDIGGKSEPITISGKMIFKNGKLVKDIILEAEWRMAGVLKRLFSGEKVLDNKGQEYGLPYFTNSGVPHLFKKRNSGIFRSVQVWKNSTELVKLFGKKVFEYPKPKEMIKDLISLVTKEGDLILDSFAGSGTTGHAVMDLNKEDGGNRKFIMIEMEDKIAKTITAKRIEQAIKKEGYKEGFEFCELDKTLFNENGEINKDCSFNEIATYIYFTETKTNINKNKVIESYIGEYNKKEVYLIYKKNEKNVLNKEYLKQVKKNKNQKIVYGDKCLVNKKTLKKHNIQFKRIPYEVRIY